MFSELGREPSSRDGHASSLLTVVTGVVYPLAVTGVAAVVFPDAANGSLIVKDGKADRQPADRPAVRRRRSTSGAGRRRRGRIAYNAGASSGSNLGPMNPALVDAVKERVDDAQSGRSRRSKSRRPGRSGDRLRQRPRSAHLARRRPSIRSAAWPRRAACRQSDVQRAGRAAHRRRARSACWASRASMCCC